MSEQTKQEQPNTKTTGQPKAHALAGTEPAQETTNVWTKAAETIAGDNKMLSSILKFILSPFGLIVAVCGLGFLIYQNVKLKTKLDLLKKENKQLLSDNKELFATLDELKARKRTKPKDIINYAEDLQDDEDNVPQLSYVQQRPMSRFKSNSQKRTTIYLD